MNHFLCAISHSLAHYEASLYYKRIALDKYAIFILEGYLLLGAFMHKMSSYIHYIVRGDVIFTST